MPRMFTSEIQQGITDLLLQGHTLPSAMAEIGIDSVHYPAIRKAYYRSRSYRDNQKTVVIADCQHRLLQSYRRTGLWQTSEDDYATGSLNMDEVRFEVDTALSGMAASYVFTPPPELRIIYSNPQILALYRLSNEPVDTTFWRIISNYNMYSRIRQEELVRIRVRLAHGILDLSQWLGSVEHKRARRCIESFEDFACQHFGGIWEEERHNGDILLLSGSYQKTMLHWNPVSQQKLVFEERWNYRPDWKLFQATYEPKDPKTIAEMGTLLERLRAQGHSL